MAKIKKEVEAEEVAEAVEAVVEEVVEEVVEVELVIKPITDTMGNGDLTLLKDKINEIITHINS